VLPDVIIDLRDQAKKSRTIATDLLDTMAVIVAEEQGLGMIFVV
jgi:hypothetical protein